MRTGQNGTGLDQTDRTGQRRRKIGQERTIDGTGQIEGQDKLGQDRNR